MTKINMDELLVDRAAGTDGPWKIDGRMVCRGQTPVALMCEFDSFGGVHEAHNGKVNARRIARLPDLEAAYIDTVSPKVYQIGPLTMDRVFRAGQLENMSDMQAVLDAVERALEAE